MKQTEDHLIFGSLVIRKCIFSQTNAVIDREKSRNNPTWDILWEFGFRNTCSRKSRPVWKWSPKQSPVLPCPVRWLPLMAARESSGTPSQQNRKNPLQILLQRILVFGFKCLKVQLPTRLSLFFSYSQNMSMTKNNLDISLLGWVLSQHQTPSMETSRDTREQDPGCDSHWWYDLFEAWDKSWIWFSY